MKKILVTLLTLAMLGAATVPAVGAIALEEVETTVFPVVSDVALPMAEGALGVDGTFETELKGGYTTGNGGAVEIVTDNTDATNKALKLTAGAGYSYIHFPITVEENANLEISVDLWTDGEAHYGNVVLFDSKGKGIATLYGQSAFPSATTSDKKAKIAFSMTAEEVKEKAPATIQIQINNAGNHLYIDNLLVMTTVKDPDSTSLLNFDGTFESKVSPAAFTVTNASKPEFVADPTDETNTVMKFDSTAAYGTAKIANDFAFVPDTEYTINFEYWGVSTDYAGVILFGSQGSNFYLKNAVVPSKKTAVAYVLTPESKPNGKNITFADALAAGETFTLGWQLNAANSTMYIDNIQVDPVIKVEIPEEAVLAFDGTFEAPNKAAFSANNGTKFDFVADPTDAENTVLKVETGSNAWASIATTTSYSLNFKEDTAYLISMEVMGDAANTKSFDFPLHIVYDGWQGALTNALNLSAVPGEKKYFEAILSANQIAKAYENSSGNSLQFSFNFGDKIDLFAGSVVYFDNMTIVPYTLDPVGVSDQLVRENVTGIRFVAHISDAMRTASSQYGFLMAREDLMNYNMVADTDIELRYNGAVEEIAGKETFTGTTQSASIPYMGVVLYEKDAAGNPIRDKYLMDNEEGNDYFVQEFENGRYYSVLLTGFDRPFTAINGVKYANRYQVGFVVRPFAVKNGRVYYGNCVNSSMLKLGEMFVNFGMGEAKEFGQMILDTAYDTVE